MSDIVERLNENIIADTFERRAIVDGALCERLIRERKEAAETIEKLRAETITLRRDNYWLKARLNELGTKAIEFSNVKDKERDES